mmetsp:Transcript_35856/g.112577  ORF Transcript_35856/g.112577 Transcript_35856/m.112577 type:complete len:309 (-) Transcript_35856:341-1267(-)
MLALAPTFFSFEHPATPLGRHQHLLPGPRPPGPRHGRGGADDAGAPRQQPVLHPAAGAARRVARVHELRRQGVLLQFRRGGQRGCHQAPAPPRREPRHRRAGHHHGEAELPRAHAGDHHGDGPAQVPRELRAAGERLPLRDLQRRGGARGHGQGDQRCTGGGLRRGPRRHHAGAAPGGGRHPPGGSQLLPAGAEALRRVRRAARGGRGADGHGPHGQALGARVDGREAGRFHKRQGARRRRAHRRHARARRGRVGPRPGRPRLHLRRQPAGLRRRAHGGGRDLQGRLRDAWAGDGVRRGAPRGPSGNR